MTVVDWHRMQAYLCVYRHTTPLRLWVAQTEQEVVRNLLLRTTLKCTSDQTRSATGATIPASLQRKSCSAASVTRLGAGVVAPFGELLDPGDYVVFVCGRHSGKRPRSWGYFLVGLA